ncbi:DoxX-like family protein [Cohnella sp. OV330]|uniref:DoxX family protein n=1 Tax=Cohnella sp. OV330 TaxID=1855288 RepID=UPI0008E5C3E6|nr:DoxX family protein [Cohnella sp. OV330]SFA74799.1 DoxX-like family protein [Cohnella sp. OV330]
MNIVLIVLQSFLIFPMIGGGATKLAGSKNFVEMFDSLRLPQWFRVVTGIVQIVGAIGLIVGYWKPEVLLWAGIWIAFTMFVAVLAHFRVKHPAGSAVPALFITLVAVALIVVQQVA